MVRRHDHHSFCRSSNKTESIAGNPTTEWSHTMNTKLPPQAYMLDIIGLVNPDNTRLRRCPGKCGGYNLVKPDSTLCAYCIRSISMDTRKRRRIPPQPPNLDMIGRCDADICIGNCAETSDSPYASAAPVHMLDAYLNVYIPPPNAWWDVYNRLLVTISNAIWVQFMIIGPPDDKILDIRAKYPNCPRFNNYGILMNNQTLQTATQYKIVHIRNTFTFIVYGE